MNTFLMAWNPKKWEWESDEINRKILEIQATGHAEDSWSCGNRKDLPVGSRFFLIRLGQAPRGIVGSGVTTSKPERGPHWDPTQSRHGKLALFVGVKFDFLSKYPIVLWDELQEGSFSDVSWNIRASGIMLPQAAADALEKLWRRRTRGDDPVLPDEVPDGPGFPEGGRKKITINAYERNPQARAACIAHFGYQCSVCGGLLENVYGSIAADFIHVHHLKPLAEVREGYKLNPKKDLRPVCPNCHAMLHQKRESAYSIEELKAIIKRVAL